MRTHQSHPALVVFSHLRWNFVFQRPQHLLSRLAQKRPVFFFEEPFPGQNLNAPSYESVKPSEGLTVIRPHLPGNPSGFADEHFDELKEILRRAFVEHNVSDFSAWFYTPMALPMIDELRPHVIIYDCMDELSAFKNAPAQLRE